MNRIRTKICGITRAEDALFAVERGVDALGFNFYPPSPRYIEPERAGEIIRLIPPFVTLVGLFVNAEPAEIDQAVRVSGVNMIQFHGDEDDDFCHARGMRYIKALRVRPGDNLSRQIEAFGMASGILLDAYSPDQYGGTGEVFDWSLAQGLSTPIILAGGLNALNVADAIKRVGPLGVDVSGGVESSPGCKDHEKIRRFLDAVNGIEYV